MPTSKVHSEWEKRPAKKSSSNTYSIKNKMSEEGHVCRTINMFYISVSGVLTSKFQAHP